MDLFSLIAQTPTPIDPAPGWFSLVLNGGAFGLVVFMIVVLMPRLRKEVATEREKDLDKFSTELKAQRGEYTASLKEIAADFRSESKAQREACEKEFTTLADSINNGNQVVIETVKTLYQQLQASSEQLQRHSERNQQFLEIMKAEVRERKQL